jgi:DNA-binding MarR family transcriptional regulator
MGVDALGTQLRDLVRVVRQLRQRRSDQRPAVPTGLLGTLMRIDSGPPGCHAKELAVGSGLDQSTVSRAVAALVAHGLVERRTDPTDKRASILAVTPAGRAALDAGRAWYEDELRSALAGWREADVEALTALLGRFIADLNHALHDNVTPEGIR